ncbi:MAG: 4'-phosphopantetheinyl transferase superfamily protein [Hydrogenophaga sp.]|uniref:4'-phosphopantetheinyl transferase family protein n=1 Tax=Hydrogenophaga sp. TaxID=1904254 RepID=UPI001D3AD956|nr:4'-phosphopantetheinyl transferase superfamily protein [Hydrogenophaga sp.]MBX3611466.1 4'-phosphopantetheinyl transferase superfamily protein [Hydrogenophaga sp.]
MKVDCPGNVDLWLIDLGDPPAEGADDRWLSPQERARAARFHFPRDAHRYRRSHQALRELLGRHLECPPESLQFAEGAHGKPVLTSPGAPPFNLSHSGRWALLGIGAETPVGVDIEVERPLDDLLTLARQNFSQTEFNSLLATPADARMVTFYRCWSRKEACLKALGSGLSIEPHVFEAGTNTAEVRTRIAVADEECQVLVRSLSLPNHVQAQAAVAWLDPVSTHLAM